VVQKKRRGRRVVGRVAELATVIKAAGFIVGEVKWFG
jgi:hypothetical protein